MFLSTESLKSKKKIFINENIYLYDDPNSISFHTVKYRKKTRSVFNKRIELSILKFSVVPIFIIFKEI